MYNVMVTRRAIPNVASTVGNDPFARNINDVVVATLFAFLYGIIKLQKHGGSRSNQMVTFSIRI